MSATLRALTCEALASILLAQLGSAATENEPVEVAPNAMPSQLVELRGRLLLPDGSPAKGVELEVRGWPGDGELRARHGIPDSWEDPTGATDPDGRFSILFEPPPAFYFMFDAKLPGYVPLAWRWNGLSPGEVKDVGEVHLIDGGTVAGQLVDQSGVALGEGWSMNLYSTHRPPGRDGSETRMQSTVDPITGAFVFEDAPPGQVRLTAYHAAGPVEGPGALVVAGETTEVEFVYEGPDPRRRLMLVVSMRPFFFMLEEGAIRVFGGRCSPCVAQRVETSPHGYSVEDLDPGAYRVEIADSRFRTWERDGVRPGTPIDVKLEGAASIDLSVFDASGEAIQDYRALLRFEGLHMHPNLFELQRSEEGSGRFDGLLTELDSTLIVEAGEHGTVERRLGRLEANASKAISIDFGSGAVVAGTVVDGEKPVARVRVWLRPDDGDDSSPKRVFQQQPSGRETLADERGRFAFPSVEPGEYTLEVGINALVRKSLDVVVESESVAGLELALPDSGFVAGRLVAEPEADLSEFSVSVENTRVGRWSPDRTMSVPTAPVDADGSFRLGPLPAGPQTLVVRLSHPGLRFPLSSMGLPGTGTQTASLGEIVVRPGGEVARDFDITSRLPGRIRLSTESSQPLDSLVEANDRGLLVWVRGAGQRSGMGFPLEADGTALIGPLFPGSWKVEVGVRDGWRVTAPRPVVVESGEMSPLKLAVEVHRATLTVHDSVGRPVAGRNVSLRPDGADNWSIVRETDEAGRITFQAPSGIYVVSDGGPPGRRAFPSRMSGVFVEWSANGPVPDTVEIVLDARVF